MLDLTIILLRVLQRLQSSHSAQRWWAHPPSYVSALKQFFRYVLRTAEYWAGTLNMFKKPFCPNQIVLTFFRLNFMQFLVKLVARPAQQLKTFSCNSDEKINGNAANVLILHQVFLEIFGLLVECVRTTRHSVSHKRGRVTVQAGLIAVCQEQQKCAVCGYQLPYNTIQLQQLDLR